MQVFEAKTYVEFVSHFLRQGHEAIPRGVVKTLAESLNCHPSFVSQILRSKAHFSLEQAVRFCSFAKLSDEEAEFFIDLLHRDRAGTPQARSHFDKIIAKKRLERQSLQKRARLRTTLTQEQEVLYFQNYVHPLVHAALHLPNHHHASPISMTIGMPKAQVIESLQLLKNIGLAVNENGKWKPTEKALHLGKDSPLNRTYHSNWRLKTAALLLDGNRTHEHTHFSSVFCIAKEDVERIREKLLASLQSLRQDMVASQSERLFVFALDYFPAEARRTEKEPSPVKSH